MSRQIIVCMYERGKITGAKITVLQYCIKDLVVQYAFEKSRKVHIKAEIYSI